MSYPQLGEIHHRLAEINRGKSIKRTELSSIPGVQSNNRSSGDNMKTKFSNTILTTLLTGAMALGTSSSVWAQDPAMDKPSAGVSAQVDQAPPPEQPAPQYNAQDQSAPQDVAPPPPQNQDTYQG